MNKVKVILVFVFSVICTFLLASIAGTQVVLADVSSFGLHVSFSDRVSATFHDIIGLSPTLSILITAALLVAFVAAAVCCRILGGNRTYWYLAAGLTSLPAALMLIKALTGGTLFAAARSGFGMLLIAFCGLAGGWVFARLSQKKDI